MKRLIRLLLCAISATALLLTVSCTGGGDNTPPTPQNDGKVDYTLTVKDGYGNPITDGLVTAYSGDTNVGMKRIGDTGTVVFNLVPGTYTLTFDNVPEDLAVDESACVFTESTRTLEVVFYNKPTASQSVFATPFEDRDGHSYDTLGVSEGVYYAKLTEGDMNYFIFTPERDGNYRVSVRAEKAVDVGCYGGPMFVLPSKSIEMDGDTFLMVIKPSYIGDGDRETTKYVIGIHGEAEDCILSIVRESDYVKTPDDEIWLDVAPTGALKPFDIGYDNYKVTPLDVTDKSLKIVYNETDGLYHHMTADGPVVLLRIGSASPYLSAFTDICDVTRLGAYIYDESGAFDRKESYNSLVWAYAAVADDGSGLYPLDDQLIYMIKQVGEYNKWWDFTTERHIFGDDAPRVVVENAYLFAACYVTYDPAVGATDSAPISVKPQGNISITGGSTLHFTSSESADLLLTVNDPTGIYKLTYGGTEYTAKDGKIAVKLTGSKAFSVTRTDASADSVLLSYTCEQIIGASGTLRLIAGTPLYFASVEEGSYTLTITDVSGYVKVTYGGKTYFADSKGKLTLTVEGGSSFTVERTDTAATELRVEYTFTKN